MSEPRVVGALPGAASVTVICEEGCTGGWGAVAFLVWPCQLPILAVVEHLASLCARVRLPLPSLGVGVGPGHIHILVRSFTAAETGQVV